MGDRFTAGCGSLRKQTVQEMMIELTNYLSPDQKTYIDPKAISVINAMPLGDGSSILVQGQWTSVKELPAEVREMAAQ